jgi:hypothetical protein
MSVWASPGRGARAVGWPIYLALEVARECAEDLMIAIRALDAKRPGLRQLYGRRPG